MILEIRNTMKIINWRFKKPYYCDTDKRFNEMFLLKCENGEFMCSGSIILRSTFLKNHVKSSLERNTQCQFQQNKIYFFATIKASCKRASGAMLPRGTVAAQEQ